ncbi:MAG TPA: universal stress protein [Candidatus Tectomicrobia bacterium]|jgi:nucleotide-binding universal stress UspA family protein
MSNTILLAVALQHWEQHRAQALAARDVAAALARGAAKHLHVLSVYAYESINMYGLPPDVAAKYRDEQIQRLDACMQRKMATYVAPLEAAGVLVSEILRVGKAQEVVVRVATEIEADLLIMGSASHRRLWNRTRSSTARQVSKRAPCPVLLVSATKGLDTAPLYLSPVEDQECCVTASWYE